MNPLRVLALLEATSVTGPAKNLLQYAELSRQDPAFPVQVEVVTFRREGDSNVFLQAADQVGVIVHGLPERGRFDRTVLPALGDLVHDRRPHILQTHAVKSHFLLRCSQLYRELPWVAFHHGYTWPRLRVRLYNQLDRWSLRAARRVVTVSEPFREELVAKGVARENIQIVHNAIPPGWGRAGRAHAAALRQQLGISPDPPIVLIVGRLSKEKDHGTLLEALAAVRGQGSEAHLLIVGDGPERSRLEEQISKLGLKSSVTFTGQVPTAEPYYGLADIAVLSSRSEGSPNALLEAMAAGVPVVATRVGGIPEIVSDQESAWLVEPGNREQMATALGRLLRDQPLAERLRAAASAILENYTPQQRMRRISGIYQEVMGA